MNIYPAPISRYPLGSNQPKVLANNASNMDEALTAKYPSFVDRDGVPRRTYFGMEQDFQQFLLNSGYQDIGDYSMLTGTQVTARNQIFLRAGEYWRAKGSTTLPYTITGTWATDDDFFVSVGDAVLRQALAAANGVGLVTGATPQMETMAALKAWRGRYMGDQVDLLGDDTAHRGRASRMYWWDDTSTATEQLPNIVEVTGIATGRWKLNDRELIRLSEWGIYGDGSDDTAKWAALMAYVAALGATGKHVTVQGAGVTKATTWPNMAYRGFILEPTGEFIMENLGTGPNLKLDGGALSGMKVDGFTIGLPGKPVTLRGGSGAGQGVYARATVGKNCEVHANIFGCGTSQAAFRSEWAVLCQFDLNITPGDLTTGSLAWFGGGVPAAGISLGQRLAGEQTSYCWFPNLVANATGVAIYLDSTLGNNIEHGDAEYSTAVGLLTTANALKDKITGMNFEVNPTDISCLGNGIVFDRCHCVTMVFAAASENCKVITCLVDSINIVSGATGTQVALTSFSRGISSSVITDNGSQSNHVSNYNMTTKKYQNAPHTVTAPAVSFPGGVFTWFNDTGDTVLVQGTGGTITNVSVGATPNVATIPYPMARVAVMNQESIAFAGSGALVVRVWKGV